MATSCTLASILRTFSLQLIKTNKGILGLFDVCVREELTGLAGDVMISIVKHFTSQLSSVSPVKKFIQYVGRIGFVGFIDFVFFFCIQLLSFWNKL